MKRLLFILLIIHSFTLAGDTTYVSGSVNGIWSNSASPYIVTSNLIIQPDDTLTLSLDLSDCIEKNSTSKVYFDQSKFFISELKDVKPEDIKVLAPHINQEFISIKRFTINENTIDGFEDLYSSIYGILEIEGKLFMVPLKHGS